MNYKYYSFTLWLGGFDNITPSLEDIIFKAGCDDATLGIHCGNPYLSFDREADSYGNAVKSAIKNIESIRDDGVLVEIIRVTNDVYYEGAAEINDLH